MVNISTNFVKTDNYLSPQIIEKKTTSYTQGQGASEKKTTKCTKKPNNFVWADLVSTYYSTVLE
jgi:hypothetical protein